MFKHLDKNGDGLVSKEEMKEGYRMLHLEGDVDAIYQAVDLDRTGSINFSDWVIATFDANSFLTPERLQKAFVIFDSDVGGTVSAVEVKEMLCQG